MLIAVASDLMAAPDHLADQIRLIPRDLSGGEEGDVRIAAGGLQGGEDPGQPTPGLLGVGARRQPHVQHGGMFVIFQIDREVAVAGRIYHGFLPTRDWPGRRSPF